MPKTNSNSFNNPGQVKRTSQQMFGNKYQRVGVTPGKVKKTFEIVRDGVAISKAIAKSSSPKNQQFADKQLGDSRRQLDLVTDRMRATPTAKASTPRNYRMRDAHSKPTGR